MRIVEFYTKSAELCIEASSQEEALEKAQVKYDEYKAANEDFTILNFSEILPRDVKFYSGNSIVSSDNNGIYVDICRLTSLFTEIWKVIRSHYTLLNGWDSEEDYWRKKFITFISNKGGGYDVLSKIMYPASWTDFFTIDIVDKFEKSRKINLYINFNKPADKEQPYKFFSA